ncbi:hypothetical protein ACGYLX_18630 [Sulfitobacter sp. 1A13496]|uniref:hypothetical protein n=1 Tax=Sulfitobacter sp. 1A13496 TaxID=3368596 RepID=UPI003744DA36
MAATSSLNTLDLNATGERIMLDYILNALKTANRGIYNIPQPFLPPHMNAQNLADFRLQKMNGGWVADIYFQNVPTGQPDAIGTRDAHPYKTKQEAFLAGAEMLCTLITGTPELPFTALGDQIIGAPS